MSKLGCFVALVALNVSAAEPVNRLAAVWTGGLLDLMTEPKRDVTASFGALVSAPIGFPREKRSAEFTMLALGLPREARALHPKLSPDAPTLVAICSRPEGKDRERVEAILQGRAQTWKLRLNAELSLFGAQVSPTHPPLFVFAGFAPVDGTPDERVKANVASGSTCDRVSRDAKGEVFLDGSAEPVHYEVKLEPWPSGSDHLLDFADDPDLAVAGLMPVETFAGQHPALPRPRVAGVLSLLTAAEALSFMGRLTLVATNPTASPGDSAAVLFVDGRPEVTVVGFRNGSFTPVQWVTPAAALTGPWSKWSWSLVDSKMPAEILLDASPAAAACLDALPRTPDPQLAVKLQQCFDLSLPDAGSSFRVRRERWLEAVRAHEAAATAKVETFCADQSALAVVPFFKPLPAGKNRNAGPLLTATLGWEKRTFAKSFPGSLKVPADLERKFSVAGFMELSDADLASVAAVDTSFLHQLADFERWDLAEGEGALTKDLPLNAAEAPLPEFSRLSLAARLHLRRAVKTGKLVEAARDVRNAARLAFSSENLIGQSVGLSLLTLEGRAWEWAKKHQRRTPGWTPVDETSIERARRVVRTAPVFFSPMTPEAVLARATACDQVTSCSGITEVVAVSAGLETLLREPWKTRYAAVLRTIAAKNERCSFALARFWSTRPMVDVADSVRSRTPEVIAGGMMSKAATAFYLPSLERWYP